MHTVIISLIVIGVIGKTNVGKSTFFNAATLGNAQIANYPFTTIEPNIGIAYATKPCVCRELGVKDNPVNSKCINGIRFIPVKLIDVAGLIPGASRGLGLGNKFLDETRRADALIHVVDASGSTDEEGRPVEPGSHDPLKDIEFVEREYELWMLSLIEKDWDKLTKIHRLDDALSILTKRFSGLGVSISDVKLALKSSDLSGKRPAKWSREDLERFIRALREINKPMIIAANKADLPTAKGNIERIMKTNRLVIPVSAEAELLLRRAANMGLIEYLPGSSNFKIIGRPSEAQMRALELVKSKVLDVYGSTGVQDVINSVCFNLLGGIVVYPVEDENSYTDKKGNVLPDAYIVKKGTTAKMLAEIVHSELAKGFLYAIDARRKVKVAADYELKDGDVIKIVSTTRRG